MNSYLLRLEQMADEAFKAYVEANAQAMKVIRSDVLYQGARQKSIEAGNNYRLLRGFADDFKTLMGEREAA